MDLVMNMLSLAKDVTSTEKQLKKLNIEIKYELQKARNLAKTSSETNADNLFIFENLNMKISEAQKYTRSFDELLNQQKLGIKDKIILNLPFDQTKKQANSVLEALRKAMSDTRQAIVEERENYGGIKRRVLEDNIVQSPLNSENGEMDENKIDLKIQEIYEMGPTIKQEEIIFSQQKEAIVEFVITLQGNQKIVDVVQQKKPELAIIKERVNFSEKITEKILYTVARANYRPVYSAIRNLTKQIDGISTKGHFHFVLKKLEQQQATGSKTNHIRSSQKEDSQNKLNSKEKEKIEEEEFFSFPDEGLDIYNSFKILVQKVDPSKTLFIHRQQQWQKIEEQELQIANGDKVAAFYNDKLQQPSIYYSIKYDLNMKI